MNNEINPELIDHSPHPKSYWLRFPKMATLVFPLCFLVFAFATTAFGAPPLPGAIFTSDSTCSIVNLNIYANKADVYLNGGPAHPGAAGLPAGAYYVQVTDPSGATVLGKSSGADAIVNSAGNFAACYQLIDILFSTSSGFTTKGYDDTPNPGGEYKVWVSTVPSFDNNSTKTDNFKVKPGTTVTGAVLCVRKFYDANADGAFDGTDTEITGWQFTIFGTNAWSTMQVPHTTTPWCGVVDPDTFHVMEATALNPPAWVHTTADSATITVGPGESGEVLFGNVCLGPGGGLTLGFWSNKNGQAMETAADFTALNLLHLVNADGGTRDFLQTLAKNKTDLNSWILSANATNMANMLSAQLTAMKLNVLHSKVSGGAIVYAPAVGFTSAGLVTGFITINDLMAQAEAALAASAGNLTVTAGPQRSAEEALKTALDDANNNKNFTQATPCDFAFANPN